MNREASDENTTPLAHQRAGLRRAALGFYGLLSFAAVLWAWLSGSPNLLWSDKASVSGALAGVGLAVLFASLVVALSRLTLRFRWARELADWFSQLLGPLGWADAALLAGLSAVGEELLFRGAMQRAWGLWPATLLFGAVHVPPRLALLPWTLSAGGIGLALGLCASWSQSLAGPIVAHFLINLLNLKHLCQAPESEPERAGTAE